MKNAETWDQILVWAFKEKYFHPSLLPTGKKTILSPSNLLKKTFCHQCRLDFGNNDKKKKRLLCCNAKTSWLEFCGVGLLFQCQEVGMSHKRARSSLKKREILFKTTTKLFQSSVERRTWCDNCICKTEISVWTWEFQSLILTKPWRGGLARIHRRSPQAPLMQHFRTSNCFTQSLAWIRWDGKWSSEVEIKTKLAPLLSDVTACLPRNWKVTAPPVF